MLANLCRKRISILTGLKVSSLTCIYFTDQNIMQREDPIN